MVKNTNAVFWIICGAIFVITVYLIATSKIPGIVMDYIKAHDSLYETADNNETPTAATFKSSETTATTISAVYAKGTNTARYECRYGEEKAKLNRHGVMLIGNETVTCQIKNVKPNTKYYIEIVSSNTDKKVSAPLVDITTKAA